MSSDIIQPKVLRQHFDKTWFNSMFVEMPGTSFIALSYGLIKFGNRSGLGAEANRMRQAQLLAKGFEGAICFVRDDNIPQQKILSKTGWSKVYTFGSRKVSLWATNLLNGKEELKDSNFNEIFT